MCRYNSKDFYVAWPQGIGIGGIVGVANDELSSWNAGDDYSLSGKEGNAQAQDVDDESFLLEMIQYLLDNNPKIDAGRIYVSGRSNGCKCVVRAEAPF